MIYTISWSKKKKTEKYMPRAEFTNLYIAHLKICCDALHYTYINSSYANIM